MKLIVRRKRGKRVKVAVLMLAIAMGVIQTGFSRQDFPVSEADSGTEDAGKVRTGSLELAPADFKLTISDWDAGKYTQVSLGSLMITIPFGWKIEQRVSDEGVKQYILTDIHSECANEEIEGHKDGYEHEIVITPYEINRMPESTLQLAAEIKMYFQVPLLYGAKGAGKTKEIEGCWMCGENRDTKEKEYFIFSEDEAGEKELFHVREGNNDVTAYQNDVEAFWKFLDKNLIKRDGGKYVVERITSSEKEYYFLLNEEKDTPLLVVVQDKTDEIAVYQTGLYQTALSTQKVDTNLHPQWFQIADLNQDGYEDILSEYWQIDPDYSYDGEIKGYLWKEKSNSFAYAADEQLLGVDSFVLKNKKEIEKLQGDEQIPEGLIAYLSEYLLKSKEELRDIMLPLVSDRELDIEEVKELAKENRDIKNELLVLASSELHAGIWIKVDVDNDGIEDIFLCEYLGGSLGPVYYYFFKGTEEGEYVLTSKEEQLKMEYAFISWEGKNYLAKTTWEFTKKCVDGINLEYYEEGKYQGGVSLDITAKEGSGARSIQTSYLEMEEYSSLASSMEVFASKYQSGQRVPIGTAEEENKDAEYRRSCDIDNDGEVEEYKVSLWQTSNYYTVDHLTFEAKEEKIYNQIYHMVSEDDVNGIFMNLWVDETDYGNVIYAIFEEGLYDFHICGYLLSVEEGRKILQVDCAVQTEVTHHSMNLPRTIDMH